METKLMLKMDKPVINLTMKHAENNHKSQSRTVGNSFKSLGYKSEMPKKYSPLIKQPTGTFSEDDLRKISAKNEKVRYIFRNEK